MKSLIINSVLCIALVLLGACNKTKDLFKPTLEIIISVGNLEFSDLGGTKTFEFKSNYDWNITSSDPLCVVSPASGKKDQGALITVTLPENFQSERKFSLTINSDDSQRVLVVKQSGKNGAMTAAEIVVDNFDILPEYNNSIYMPISFVQEMGIQRIFNSEQKIEYYKHDLADLVASWSSNATKVTVNNTIQESGITKNNYQGEVTFRFYALDNSYKDYKIKLTNPEDSWSGLPVLVLTTDDKKDIVSKEIWSMGKFKLDPQGNTNTAELEGITEIRGRGNSTWNMPKKPFALKLKDKASGTFMGMNPHKRWALLANYSDKTSLRNKVAFELGKKLNLPWTSDSRFVEVIVNGKFMGNYLLTEQIKIDKNRVNIDEIDNKETDPTKISGGWLMEVDRYYSNGETRYFRPAISQIPIIVKDPEDANTEQMNYIANYFNTFEKMIFPSLPQGVAYNQSTQHLGGTPDSTQYGKYIDINSFVNYWIVQEITENRDSRLPGSVYMHKGVNQKLVMGPLWDFDLTTFLGSRSWLHYNYVPSELEYNTLEYRAVYYNQLFKDAKFKAKVKERWNAIYSSLLNDIPKFIDKEYNTIKKSLDLNWIDVGETDNQGIWALSDEDKSSGGRNHDKNLKSDDAVNKLRSNYLIRINWMNSQINSW
ncbi:CotH kinase family protein [Sphingobacterium rhinopitheci]|uniref:CotH kinase family protein n=1 Tax=Sphingobacterium rhinopitheci TaxID=2781960 RepID=UPI001F51AA09|nr:CotH kinase family protein [Sphingobacterium rhinopitheci]MCI0921232.1 CotH kinase family protein [Sphingobacterium rhinopitheci]